MDARDLSEFIIPGERIPGAPESPSNRWYAVCPVGVNLRRSATATTLPVYL
jgi:hypothetical protein